MPEFNRNFSKGKMSKDLDERLVPAGEYRDALNVEVSTSADSDVGALQTVLGNVELTQGVMPQGSHCVGSIVNNEENCIYYLVAGAEEQIGQDHFITKDAIIKHNVDTGINTYVFVDIYRVVVNVLSVNDDEVSVTNNLGIRPGMIHSNIGTVKHINGLFGAVSNTSFTLTDKSNAEDLSGAAVFLSEKRVLNFNSSTDITGINIVDDFIMFTDNSTEPKLINIKRSIMGTGVVLNNPQSYLELNLLEANGGNYHTRLVTRRSDGGFQNNGFEIARDQYDELFLTYNEPVFVEEEHVTTIKKAPLTPPTLKMSSTTQERSGPVSTTLTSNQFIQQEGQNIGEPIPSGTQLALSFNSSASYQTGDFLLLTNDETQDPLGFTKEDIRVQVLAPAGGEEYGDFTNTFNVVVTSINTELSSFEEFFVLLEQKTPMFEFKFPRFSYRYKYVDGQYSSFAPFSEVAFLPGPYKYYPKEGYNLAMANRVRSLRVENYAPHPDNRPEDVVEIDILYKEDKSTNVYTVKTIKQSDGGDLWPAPDQYLFQGFISNSYPRGRVNRGSINIESELIHAVVAENQLLRPWDNVPRKALAQEVSANRLIYANYVQNYDMFDAFGNLITPMLSLSKNTRTYEEDGSTVETAFKSIKTMRTYQLGVVYKDEYGRETPVMADKEKGSIILDKEFCASKTSLTASISSKAPYWAKSFKFFIKETSNEYYNMAMDRWYNAEDGNVWLSFPSSDRNKVDIDTFIELKKAHDNSTPVLDKARYKILAIENEAPQDIKINRRSQGIVTNATRAGIANNVIGDGTLGFPIDSFQFVTISAAAFEDTFGNNDSGNNPVYTKSSECSLIIRRATGDRSEVYQIVRIEKDEDLMDDDTAGYKIHIDKAFGPDVNFASTNNTFAGRRNFVQVEITHDKFEDKPEFDGKFFVNVFKDKILEDNIMVLSEDDLTVINAFKVSYLHTYAQDGTNLNVDNSNNKAGGIGANVNNDYWDTLAEGATTNPYNSSYTWNTDNVVSNIAGFDYVGNDDVSGVRRGVGKGNKGKRFWHDYFTSEGKAKLFIDDAWAISWRQSPHTIPSNWTGGNVNSNYDIVNQFDSAPSRNGASTDIEEDALWNSQSGGYYNGSKGLHGNQIDISVSGGMPGRYNQDVYSDDEWQTIDGMKFLGSASKSNPANASEIAFLEAIMEPEIKWRFRSDPEHTIYTTVDSRVHYGIINYQLQDFDMAYSPLTGLNPFAVIGVGAAILAGLNFPTAGLNVAIVPKDYHIESNKRNKFTIRVNKNFGDHWDPRTEMHHDGSDDTVIEIMGAYSTDNGSPSDNPAVFETYPKEDIGLDIYYEIGRAYPITLAKDNDETLMLLHGRILSLNGVKPEEDIWITDFRFEDEDNATRPCKLITSEDINDLFAGGFSSGDIVVVEDGWGGEVSLEVSGNSADNYFFVQPNVHNATIKLPWHNCYTFGNGIESDRIRDDFNAPTIQNGVKASTTLAEQYKEEKRGTGLIFSGIFNSRTGVNRFNQFIQAEPITKDLNPDNGSIQKLFSRKGDIVTLCEDKVLKILSQKDALFNADGNTNVTATNKVLGQAVPFAGDYGISKNPESFASDNFRCYFTDVQRGAVIRLSMDGMTNISDYGMKNWFTDKFYSLTNPRIIGSFDDRKGNYNITIKERYNGRR